MSQTVKDPEIPNILAINDGLVPGKMLRIQGVTPATSQRFNINLQCGPNVSPRDDIALHLSVRPTEGYIARNSLNGGTWGEEQGQGYNPIAPGQPFEILLLTDTRDYKIAINGKHFCEFVHRIPINKVSHLTIDGDVSIKLINFELGAPPPAAPANAPPQAAGPPQQYGGPQMYGPPGQPPMGAYGPPPGQQPYGGPGPYGPYGPPPPPGHNPEGEKGGLEGFLGQAGAAIAGAFGNAVLQGALSGKQGAGQQTQQQPPPPQQQPQQPLAGGYGGQSVGGLGSIGSFLTNTLSDAILKPKQKKQIKKKQRSAEKAARKAAKKASKEAYKAQKALKYGAPTAGIGFVGYGLKKPLKQKKHHKQHHKRSSGSSSSSSDSD